MTNLLATWGPMGGTIVFLACAVVIARVAFGIQARTLEGYSFTEAAFEHDNPAVLIRLSGMVMGLIIAMIGSYIAMIDSYQPEGPDIGYNLANGLVAFLGALVAIGLSRYVNDFFILHSVSNNTAVVKEKNVAVAIVEFATFIATGLIYAGGMADPSHDMWFNALWFVIGQSTLIVLAFGYSLFAQRVFAGIAAGNAACALSLAGILIACGLAISFAVYGASEGWANDITKAGKSMLIWAIVAVVTRLAFYLAYVSRARHASELVSGNWAAGLLDAILMVSVTAALVAVHG